MEEKGGEEGEKRGEMEENGGKWRRMEGGKERKGNEAERKRKEGRRLSFKVKSKPSPFISSSSFFSVLFFLKNNFRNKESRDQSHEQPLEAYLSSLGPPFFLNLSPLVVILHATSFFKSRRVTSNGSHPVSTSASRHRGKTPPRICAAFSRH